MTARMLTTLHTSTAMLTMPEENRDSTVSTSPTNREATAPGSRPANQDTGKRESFRHMALRRARVSFWPSTVSKNALPESKMPARASVPKYSSARVRGMPLPSVRPLTARSNTRGGVRPSSTAPATAASSARVRGHARFSSRRKMREILLSTSVPSLLGVMQACIGRAGLHQCLVAPRQNSALLHP